MSNTHQDEAAQLATLTPNVRSEVGRLRTVVLHRPGRELERLTPRNSDRLLFDAIPWVARAQEEHDAFVEKLRDRDVEVLYLRDLLTETLDIAPARELVIGVAAARPHLGPGLSDDLATYLHGLGAKDLAAVLMEGLRFDEMRELMPAGGNRLVNFLSSFDDFVVEPLPNLLFTRDSACWIGDHVAVTSLAMEARVRETSLTQAIYTHHPRFAGSPKVYEPGLEHVEGGDVLVMGDGVLAIGTGERTTPAGVERFARKTFAAGVAHTVMAVPIAQERATMHLDTIATMVDRDIMVMYPAIADTLTAITVRKTDDPDHLDVQAPRPFLEAAADALGFNKIRLIDTGLDPVAAEREQWDDGNNTLAVGPGLVLAYERNDETNERMERAGIEVIRMAGSELGSGRGGPRCMSCPILRDPLPQ